MATSLRAMACVLALSAGAAGAQQHVMLDGIQVEQSLSQVEAKLGKPFKVQALDKGWSAYVFQEKDHYLVLQTHEQSPDEILNIQITGTANAPLHGYGDVNLGDDLAATVARLGKPDRVEQATDEANKQAVADTTIYYYGDFTFETSGGKLTSLKLERPNTVRLNAEPDLRGFLELLRGGDACRIAESLSPTLAIHGKSAFAGPMLDAVQDDPGLRDILFGKNGLASLDPARVVDSALRIHEPDPGHHVPGSAYVFKFKKGTVKELVFAEGHAGWMLYEVN